MFNKVSFVSLLMIIGLFSCKREGLGDCFVSTGDIVDEQRMLVPFHHIEVYDRLELTYTQADFNGVNIVAGENLLELISTEVENGTLVIENRNTCNWVRSFNPVIKIEIFSTDLSEITYFGHGTLDFNNQLNTDTFLVNMWESSGDLSFNVDAIYVELKSHTGTGTITCIGEADELVAFIGGNGFVESLDCQADKVLAVNENTGELRINCQQNLKANITSRGDIFYRGSPSIELNNSGSGRLINVN